MCKEGQTDTGPDRSESAPLAMAHAAGFRIQVAPATALAELAARAELAGGSLAQAAALVPSGLLAQVRAAEKEGQTADWKNRAASASHLAEAVARLETWLISTRGAELRKTKSSAAALRVVAHVAYAHARCSEEATEMSEDPTATRRPIAPAVEMELPSDSFVGHVVGRNGCFVRRLLAEHDSVCRIRVQGAKVRIVGKQEGLQEDVEAIAVKVRYQVFTTIYQSWKYLAAAARGRRPRRAGATLPLGFPPPRASEAEEEGQWSLTGLRTFSRSRAGR